MGSSGWHERYIPFRVRLVTSILGPISKETHTIYVDIFVLIYDWWMLDAGLLSVFQIVKFNNDVCTSDNNKVGQIFQFFHYPRVDFLSILPYSL